MTDHDSKVARVRAAFRDLHREGCFVMPNPWDVGTARWLRAQGFKALATTSAGFAFTQGRADQDVGLDLMLRHIAEIARAAPDLPVNADFENGYADAPEGVAANVAACVATGVAGLSIEDATGRSGDPLYELPLAVERIRAARAAIDATGSGVMLTARAECFLTGHEEPLREAARRIAAYAEAGADVLYAPGPKTLDEMKTIVSAAGGKPVNILVHGDFGLTVGEIAATGARRISVGGALARAAWAAFISAAETIAREGRFTGFAANGASAPLTAFLKADLTTRNDV
ncbi:MAG: 2-methylisocitrate lyase [Rhizobiales bacterium 65-9]|nr:isocitrate lyase/phosphoenolpyruvate mutase family protein [Hyphomicrobiales bacterium]OJY32827.1 MAG: 2-methylisocitrate lyase [Rhizobiales bacterium 65-9]